MNKSSVSVYRNQCLYYNYTVTLRQFISTFAPNFQLHILVFKKASSLSVIFHSLFIGESYQIWGPIEGSYQFQRWNVILLIFQMLSRRQWDLLRLIKYVVHCDSVGNNVTLLDTVIDCQGIWDKHNFGNNYLCALESFLQYEFTYIVALGCIRALVAFSWKCLG